MQSKDKLLSFVLQYANTGEKEKKESEPLLRFLEKFEGNNLIYRKNFDGHITASAFIVNKDLTALLLLKHKALNRWLQPGGHIDASDTSVADAALREACEETGLSQQHLILESNDIFDIDSHNIPANDKKSEPAHVHHDIRYLFRCNNSSFLNISLSESTDSKWIALNDLTTNADFYWVANKIEAFLPFMFSPRNEL